MPQTELPVIPPLPVQHREQTQLADCLAACAAMVLNYLQKSVAYERLLQLMGIGPVGAPRRNILQLSQLGISVVYREASLAIVADYLANGHPVIAFVDTVNLPATGIQQRIMLWSLLGLIQLTQPKFIEFL